MISTCLVALLFVHKQASSAHSGDGRAAAMLFLLLLCAGAAARPHIVLIVADDLGWNDVGFHGSDQIPTPNIDALAYSGRPLQQYYVAPICTPSRAALMTGKYPIHTGMQHGVIYGMEPRGLPLSEKILPQYLKELGYKTHLVGKWHLGHYKKEYLPLNRGFDSHTGFWTGKIDMYDHTNQEHNTWGTDFRRGFEVAHDLFGQYATDVYTDEAIKVITAHNKTEPLFLMIAHSAVHSGNRDEFLRAPDSVVNQFEHIKDYQRRKFAAVMSKLDESVGKVVESLQSGGLLENSIVIFTTDNGGAAAGFNDNAASNYPLRGVKNTLWEGGVRGAALLWSPLLACKSKVASQSMHISDWLPTLVSAAGGNASNIENIDGFDLWPALSEDQPSVRTSILHNIDDIFGSAAISVDKWKLHKGTNNNGAWDSWYGPSGRNSSYDLESVYAARAGKALASIGLMPARDKAQQIRQSVTVVCDTNTTVIPCKPLEAPCLFNIEDDPCERFNMADKEPEVLQRLLEELDKVNRTAIPPNNKKDDLRGDPKYWGRVYTNFGDYATNYSSTFCV
ncbi:arylsulfatase I [Choristoneura fumiferana]|uniref:arylsulfatase I n=1 Tax=Choristoneura fumiferana TaxID=7141 RepID=UPI003D15CF32